MHDFIRYCHFNPGFLTSYFFPNYIDGKPMSLMNRPYAFSMMNYQVGGSTTIAGSRQTAKSSTFGARQLMMTHMYPGFRSLYVTPHSDHKKTYADKLMEMSRAFRFNKVPSKYRQNLYYKEFPGGGMIKLIYALTSAMAARGNTVDEILFDEYQNFDSSLEDAILEAQKNSRIPSVVYAGTALTTDTALEAKYQQSSKGVFMIRCGCGEWLNTGDRDTALDLIQPEGITCPKCSRLQDVRRAELVHESTEMLKARRIGMRVPQIIIPQFIDDAVEYGRLYAKKASGVNLSSLLQENLGIPVEEGGREITQKDLEDMCVLVQSECKKKAREGRYKFVVGAVDYGGSDYNAATKTKKSYTIHSVQGVNHDNTIDIIHFQEYAGMSYDDISDMIINTHFDLKCSNLATDFGGGEVYRDRIRLRLGDWRRHFIFGYVGPHSAPVGRPKDSEIQNHYSLNRTESLTALFKLIKSGRLRCFEWPLASRFLLDFLNLYRGLDEDHEGSTKWTYRKHGSKTDDALHSINFGQTLIRLMLDEPLIPDRKLRDEVLSALRRNNTVPGLSRRHGHVSG